MVEIKQAVGSAVQTFSELFPNESNDVRLEEVMHSEDDHAWKITISIPNPDFDKEIAAQREANKSLLNPLGVGATGVISSRRYKAIEVSSSNGELVSIRNA